MLIFAGILTTLILSAAIEATRAANEKAKNDEQWFAHNRMVKHAQERARSGVGTWH
jgi:hypothetical protein